ncbi:hypothetical protein GCM10020358_52890 [Amorphoplanes nipponensis]|uniref:Ryanodine receptor Ryr domain-containing protein n=1 Tax=Actinoplanes nipponensis TaxID=135950 RepID=A0A919JFM3_9ACTN|nr:RyR domain-containing protein [Actinoplanes nipponensis]GIE49571.1 hypothetical protein Ani05nite_31050 [Actinoplanes nipponensis]
MLAPNPVWGEPETLTAELIERLARREHDRWCRFQRANGWRYGERRDDAGRQHPDLVEWERLSEAAREKDREAVRQLPELLADAGFRIVRVGAATASAPRRRPAGESQGRATV